MTDRCQIPRCHADADVTYLGHGICSHHWKQLTNENAPPEALRMALGITAGPEPPTEEIMSKTKKEQKTETNGAATAPNTAEANPPAEAKRASKASHKVKPEKATKNKREGEPKEALCVFALRLTPAERDALHRTAGPAKASKFARTILVAAANQDEAAIRTAMREVREAGH